MTYQEELELKNKLSIAQFGLLTIVRTCEERINMYVQSGKDGTSVTGILTLAESTLDRVGKLP